MTEVGPRHQVACWKAIKDSDYERQ